MRKVTRKLKHFVCAWTLNSNGSPLRLLSVRFVSRIPFSSRRNLSPPSLAPIKGRSLLSERRTRTTSSSRHRFLSTALLLRSSPSRLAACTAGRDSRPPKPHSLSPVREKGDKVFGERSARLLAASSRTIRSPTTTSPTTTTSLTSTTSSTTWRTPNPSPVPLLLLLSRTCFYPFYWRFCYSSLF